VSLFKGIAFRYALTYILIISLFLLIMPEIAWLLAQEQEAELLLQQGKQDYMMGRFEEAIDKLSRAIELLTEEEKLIDAYLHLAISHFALSQMDEVKEALTQLTLMQPQYKIDPLFYPPDFIKLHEEVKEKSFAHLSLKTEPTDVEVYLDGKLAGKSPIKIRNLLPGEHRLKLVKEGYQEKEELIALPAGVESEISLQLEKKEEKKPTVAVTPPEKKPEVKKGKGWLWILLGGAAAAAVAIFAARKGKEAGTPTPTQGFGSIQVKSYPNGASIFLDGQNTGFRTNHTLTNISTGRHSILLRLAGWKNWQDEVTVYKDQTAVVKPCLLPPNGCFRDNFQDGDSDGWDLRNGCQINSHGGNYFLDFRPVNEWASAEPHTTGWHNYSIRFKLTIFNFASTDEGATIHFRNDTQGFYHIQF